MAVKIGSQRGRIGTKLLKHVFATYDENVIWLVNSERSDVVIEFYKKNGFHTLWSKDMRKELDDFDNVTPMIRLPLVPGDRGEFFDEDEIIIL